MPPRHPIFVLTVVVLIGLCFGATPSAAQTNVIGQWSSVNPLPDFPVHTHMLPTGKMMIWQGRGEGGEASGVTIRSWDPANQSVSSLSNPGYDIFCSGHSFLADGRLFVAGGHISDGSGLSKASIYNPFTNAWSNLPNMNAGRWYPTTTVLANGDVLVVSGNIDPTIGVNTLPQVFQPNATPPSWRNLNNAQLAQQQTYAIMLLAPNGRVLYAGPPALTRYLNTSGTGAWSDVGTRAGGTRSYGSAVMYEPGKVLVMGGEQNPPKNTAEVIDLNAASPSWHPVDSMQFGRRHLNATLLPDGKVLVTGGTAAPGFNEPSGHVDAAELWDPATGNWTTLASSSGIPRVYHSTALLLPDGRVLSTGGNGYPQTEIYSPPYLFKGPRPTITSAPSPSSVAYGQSFFVPTPDAATISKITILRLSSVTHAFNMSQYINELSFSPTTGGLNVTAPRAPTAIAIASPPAPPVVAPPGYYLLFLLNGNGVPSVARIIKLGGTAPSDTTPPTVSISVPTSGATVSGTAVTVAANASDDVGVVGVQFKLDGTTNLGAEDTTSPYSVPWNSTTATNGPHTLTAVARDAAGNTTTSAGVAVTVTNAGPSCTQTPLNVSAASSDGGFAYQVNGFFGTPSDNSANLTRSVLRLFENSLELGPAHSAHGDIRNLGQGRFSHWTGTAESLRFAASNNTNPRTNGRSYTYCVPGTTGPDPTPPTVSITAPASGATVSGTAVTVAATASDNVGVAGVQFKLDGTTNLGAEDTTPPYSVPWNSTSATNGPHTLTAVARDAAGNTTTSAGVSVTVNNAAPDPTPPTVSITAPASGATVSGNAFTVAATASDNVGVAGVQFKLDGTTNLGAEDTTSPYSVPWNSTTATNGPHTLTAVARDAAGNTTTSASVSVTVNNAGPSCTQTPLNVSAASSDGGFAYQVNRSFGTPSDNSANLTRSVLRLFENSLELGPAHSAHANIRSLGQGRFSHWTGTAESLRFAASDNTNPRTNGRSYTYCVP